MSDYSRNNIPEDSIEETRRKKIEEFRRTANRSAIRGDYDGGLPEPEPTPERTADYDYSTFQTPELGPEGGEEGSQRRRRKNREINSYSDNDTKKRIERDSKKALKQQQKEDKQIEKSKAKRNRRIFKLVWLTMIILIAVVLSQYLLVGFNDLMAISREDDPTKVEIHIPEDPTLDEIADILYEKNVIKQRNFFKMYVQFTSSVEGFRQGDFEIETDKDYEAIVNFLQSNVNRTDIVPNVQITEGMSVLEIADMLHEKGVLNDEQEFLKLCNDTYFDEDFTFLKEIKNPKERYYKLEGYLFPDTYEFYRGEDPKSIITKLLNNYENKVILHKDKYFSDSKKKVSLATLTEDTGYSVDEIMTIASIIQAEAASRDDMYNISSVLHNRLKYGAEYGVSKLNCDCTVYYPYRKQADVPDSISASFQSRYDTNNFDGLPPGPICNPGVEAIKAAINPNETEYLYFCHDKVEKGSTPFYATTFEEHEQNLENIKNGTTDVSNEYDYYYYGYESGYESGYEENEGYNYSEE